MNQLKLTLFPLEDEAAYVYFFQAGDYIKIGHSIGLKNRAADIQTSNPFKLKLVKFFKFDDVEHAIQAENDFHYYFREFCVRGEWFAITPSDIPEFIPRYVDETFLAIMYSMAYCVVEARKFSRISMRLKKLGIEFNPFLLAMNRAIVEMGHYSGDYWDQVRLITQNSITIDGINNALIQLNGDPNGSVRN